MPIYIMRQNHQLVMFQKSKNKHTHRVTQTKEQITKIMKILKITKIMKIMKIMEIKKNKNKNIRHPIR